MREKSPLFALALAVGMLACSPGPYKKDGTAKWTPGKADGRFDIRDEGPLGTGKTIELDSYVPSYRIESFGNMKVKLALAGVDGSDPYMVVEGPLPNDGDGIAPGSGKLVGFDDDGGPGLDSALEVTLAAPGVYRVIAGSYETLGLGDAPAGEKMTLSAQCEANCYRPELSQKQFLSLMRDRGALDQLEAAAEKQIQAMVPDPTMQANLVAKLQSILASQNFDGVERFPTISLSAIAKARPLLGAIHEPPPAPDAVVNGDLAQLLGPCDADRSLPPRASQYLPADVGNGHFPDRTLSACQVAHSQSLAHILTSLAANNGSVVRYQGRELHTPRELFAALIDSGHTIESRNERTYANFISLTVGERDVRWPVWLDTGFDVGGSPLSIPVGHSGQAWRIHGPLVDARIMFYLGISGAAFFPEVRIRPAWTGHVARDVVSSDDNPDEVLATVDVAARYLARNRIERKTLAAGMPDDGYGYLGVCNDSNAVVEYVTHGTVTTYPLLRAASLDQAPPLGDGLDDAIRALPKDADNPPSRTDALTRILDMTPHKLSSPLWWDAGLQKQLVEANREINGN